MDYKDNEFKALVFEYMSHGSLEERLHHKESGLNLNQRLDIAIDVASAMYYLHEECEELIIHCDLKPSNVLLDSEMIAHVSDFGLAKLIADANGFSDGQTSTIGVKGTVGNVAPEYAIGGEPSKKNRDIDSHGILVLEMFTGRRPSDDIFEDNFNLRKFVEKALPERIEQIVDSALLKRGSEQNDATKHNNARLQMCLVSVLQVKLACPQEWPNETTKIGDVIKELEKY